MRHTVSERRKKWFFLRSMFRAFWEHLDKHNGQRRKKSVTRPLFAEALEARVMFSASPAPVEPDPEPDEAPVAQVAEIGEVVDGNAGEGEGGGASANATVALVGGRLEISDTSGDPSSITLRMDGSDLVITDAGGSQRIAIDDITADIIVNGGVGDDTLTIDLSGGTMPRNIVFHGGAGGTDTLVVTGGTFGTVSYDATNAFDGVLDFGDFTVTFTGLEPIDLTGSTITDLVVDVDPSNLVAGSHTTTIAPGALATDTLVTITGGFESVLFRSLTGTLTINGENGQDDAIIFSGLGSSFAGNLAINGGSSTDSITVNTAINLPGKSVTLNAETVNLNADIAVTSLTGSAAIVNVAAGASIQDGISVAAAGATVNVAAGTYSEAVTVNKQITLIGSGDGSNPASDTIIDAGAAATGLNVTTSGLSTLERVTVQGLRVTNATHGLGIASGASFLTFEEVTSTANVSSSFNVASAGHSDVVLDGVTLSGANVGFRVGTAAGVTDLSITDSVIENNNFGMFVAATSSSTANQDLFDDITITNTLVQNNSQKGLYLEKLNNALFENLTILNSGTDAAYGFNNGIDINLKYGQFENIQILNSTFNGSGLTGTNANGAASLAIKARNDAPGYSANPATLDGVNVQGNVFINGGVNDTAVRLGEFGKSNDGPVNVVFFGNSLSDGSFGKVLDNTTTQTVDASGNWWGSAVDASVFSSIGGAVDFTSFLNSGTDTDLVAPGFQGDFSTVHVTALGAQTGSLGRIQEGINRVTVGGTVVIGAGTYSDNITISKRITLDGAGSGAGGGDTIIQSAAAGTPVITVTGSGLDATNRLVIQDVRVTGATGSGNPGSGILVAGASPGGYFTFDNVASVGNGGEGFAFNSTASITDVVISDSLSANNGGAGIRIASAVPNFTGLEVTNSQVSSNGGSGFSYNPSGTLTNVGTDFDFTGVTFTNNGTAGAANTHDLSFFGFHGDATLTNVTVTSGNGVAANSNSYGIVFTNASAYAPSGTIVLDNVDVTGHVGKGGLTFQYYSDISNISLTDVDVSGVVAPWGQVILDSTDTDPLDLGNTTLANVVLWNSGGVDASGTTPVGTLQIFGGPLSSTVIGSSSGDLFNLGGGNDVIDGGLGTDTAAFSGNAADYVVTLGVGTVTVTGPDGSDTLTSIETLQFADTTVAVAPIVGPHTITGTSGNDAIILRQHGTAGEFVEILVNGLVTELRPTAGLGPITVNGTDGNDTLTVDYSNGSPIPNGLVYNGGNPTSGSGDTLRIIGTGTEDVVYTPNVSTFGNGVLDIDGTTVTFTGLEPVDVVGAGSFTLALAGANDLVDIANGLTGGGDPALILSGSSGGVPFELARVRNTTTVTIDTTATDGNDTITITSASNAHGNTHLEILTGNTGTDSVTLAGTATFAGDVLIQTGTLDLTGGVLSAANATFRPQSGGTVGIGGGAGTLNLTDAELTTHLTVPGTVTIGGTSAGTVTIDALDVSVAGYDLEVVSGTQINQTGNLTTGGNITIQANQGNAAGHDFDMSAVGGGVSLITIGGDILIQVGAATAASTTNLRQVTASGNVTVSTGGLSAITYGGAGITAGGTVSLTSAKTGASSLTGNGSISAGGDVTLQAAGDIAVNATVQTTVGSVNVVSTAGTVVTAAAGGITAASSSLVSGATSVTLSGDVTVSGSGGVVVTSAGSLAFSSVINAGSGIIDIDANSDGVGVEGVAIGGAAEFTTSNATASAIHLQVNNPGFGAGDEGDLTVTTVGGKFTAGNGGTITISTESGSTVGDARMTFGNGGVGQSLTFNVGATGNVFLNSEDYILINPNMTLNVVGGGALTINANQDNLGLDSLIMYAGGGPSLDGAIVSDSTRVDAVTINVGTTTGASLLYDISVGTGGGITANSFGGASSISVGATGLVSAPGAGKVAINGQGNVDVSGTIDGGTGLIDLVANSVPAGNQVFTMGVDGLLTTDSPAANSVSVFVFDTTGPNTVRGIDTLGGVNIDINGSGSVDIRNTIATLQGISAGTVAGDVTINAEGSIALYGKINAGIGRIDIDANSDGSGSDGITLGAPFPEFLAALSTANTSATAIHLQVNTPTADGDEGDMTLANASFTTGNGGTITLSTISGSTTGVDARMIFGTGTVGQSVIFNAGTNGNVVLDSEDYILINADMTVNVQGGSTLEINANRDGAGNESLLMYAGATTLRDGAIVSNSTHADAVTINVGTTTGASLLYDISVGTGGGITVNHLGGASSISVGATGLVSAPGAGKVSITGQGNVDVSGTINGGTGLIDIVANSVPAGNQVFTMGVDGLLTTDSPAANSVSVFVFDTTGPNTVRGIDTLGGVNIDINGSGSVDIRNTIATLQGISAGTVAGDVTINAEGSIALYGKINAGIGRIDIDANSDGSGSDGITLGHPLPEYLAALSTANTSATAIHLQVNTPTADGDEGDMTLANASFTTGNGGTITLSTISGSTTGVDARMAFGTGTVGQSVIFNAGTNGNVVLDSEDYILINADMTVNVQGGSTLEINANQDGLGNESLLMYAGATTLRDGAIVSNSTHADAVTINVGTTTGTSTLFDILVGNGGGITATSMGGSSSIGVGATGLVSAPGAGTVAIDGRGNVDVSGTIDAGTGLIDIVANSEILGSQVFTMGIDGRLTTDSIAANSVSVFVGTTTGSNTVREIETTGGVVFDVDGEGTITFSNDGSGNGITASGAGNVTINTEGAAAFNGLINAGSGIIDIDANSDGSGSQSISMGGAAAFTTTNAGATAIHLQVNNTGVGASDDGDINVNTTAGSFTVGNGGTITLSSMSGTTVGDARVELGNGGAGQSVTFNAGVDGTILIEAEDYALIRQGMTANVTGGSTLTIKGNQDGAGTEFFQMYTGGLGGNIVSDSTKSDAVNIEVNTTGGGTAVANVRNITVGNGGGINVLNHGAIITTETGTTLTATNGTVELRATNLTLDGNVSAVGGAVTIDRSVAGGTIGVYGATAFGDMQISQAELNRISAATLNIGDAVAAANNATLVRVNGVSTTVGVTGLTRFTALDAAGSDVEFLGANTFHSVEANANDLVDLQGTTSVTTATGGATFNADADDSGVGNYQSAAGSSVDTSGGGGDVEITAADFAISATSAIDAGAGDISLLPSSTGRTVELGGTALGLDVTLSDAELDTLTSTGSLRIGNASTGDVTVSAAVSPAGAPATVVTTAGTVFDESGALNDYSGTSLTIDGDLESGATPAFGILDVTGSFTFADNNTFVVDIKAFTGAPVAGTDHDQVATTGGVTIGSNVILDLNLIGVPPGAKPPTNTTYTIVDNGGAGPVTGLFVDAQTNAILGEGDWIDQGLVLYTISYVGGDGNDIVLTSLGPVETAATLDANRNLLLDDIETTTTDDTLTLTVVGNNLRIHDPNVVVGFDGIPSAVRIDPNTIDIPLADFNGLIVNTGAGDDSVTFADFSDTSTFSDFLLVDGGAGTDTINFNADYSGTGVTDTTVPEAPANRAVELRADTINVGVGADIASTVGGGTISLLADRNILVSETASIATQDGDLTLEANLAGLATGNFAGIYIGHVKNGGVDLTINGIGDLRLEGQGGTSGAENIGVFVMGSTSDFSNINVASGDLEIIGTGGSGSGVAEGVIFYRTDVNRGGAGILSIVGTGGSGGYVNHGVELNFDSTFTSNGGSGIVVNGQGGSGTDVNMGVVTNRNVVLETDSGPISIDGTGAGTGAGNTGVSLQSTTIDAATTVTISGTGSATGTTTSNIGTAISSSSITSGAGNMTITGTAGTGTSGNSGVSIGASTLLRNGAGTLSVSGTGNGTTTANYGVSIDYGSTLTSNDGSGIVVDGQGGNGAGVNIGVVTNRNVVLETDSGPISIDGTGAGTGAGNTGVSLQAATLDAATTVTVSGTGSATGTTTSNIGTAISSSSITSGAGDMTITGTAGSGTGGNSGVTIGASTLLRNGAGTLSVSGTGNGTTTGNFGVSVDYGSSITSNGGGGILVTGQGGSGTNNNYGITTNRGVTLSTNLGGITMIGTGAGSEGANVGVNLLSATFNTAGALSITGTGSQTAVGAVDGNKGVFVSATSLTSTGALAITGHGGRGSYGNCGIEIGSSSILDGGTIALVGIANVSTTGSDNAGVRINSSTLGSSGTFTIDGSGGGGTGMNHGIYMETITNTGGAIIATGSKGAGATSLDETGNFFA